jgi:hypothetical protein
LRIKKIHHPPERAFLALEMVVDGPVSRLSLAIVGRGQLNADGNVCEKLIERTSGRSSRRRSSA